MIRAVLYDVDGVIIKDRRFSDRFPEDFGISPNIMSEFFHGPYRLCQLGKADLYTELDRVKETWGWQGTTSELIEYWFSDINTSLNTGLLASVSSVRKKGVKCYIATNQEVNRAEYLWEDTGLNKYFNGIFASCDIGSKKPDSEYLESIIKKLKLSPEEIAFFDNDQRAIDTAKALGIEAYLYTDLKSYQKKLETLLV